MFSLGHLRFLLCSRDLDVLHVQRIIGFFKSELPTNQRGRKIRSRGTHGQYRGLSPVLRERDSESPERSHPHFASPSHYEKSLKIKVDFYL